jgi:hypothetical protein
MTSKIMKLYNVMYDNIVINSMATCAPFPGKQMLPVYRACEQPAAKYT